MTDDVDLRRLAVVYLTAVHEHRPPTATVQEQLGLDRAEAGRQIRAARETGLLPPVKRGNATPDEGHWPRVAKLLSGRAYWVVCQTCHEEWPCRDPATLHWIDDITGGL